MKAPFEEEFLYLTVVPLQICADEAAEETDLLNYLRSQSGKLRVADQIFTNVQVTELLSDSGRLGEGGYGTVHRMYYKGFVMAVKQMELMRFSMEEKKRIIRELYVLPLCSTCPFIVNYFGYIMSEELSFFVCMEQLCCSGEDVFKLLKSRSTAAPEFALGRIACSVIHALSYLKDNHGIIHRDIKPSNILFDWEGRVKVCDFGLCGKLVNSIALSADQGCLSYMSPERLQPSADSAMVDPLRVVCMHAPCRDYFRHPYKTKEAGIIIHSTIINSEPPRLPDTGQYSRDLQDFIKQCLIKDVEQRPKYARLKKQPFFTIHNANFTNISCNDDVCEWLENLMESAP